MSSQGHSKDPGKSHDRDHREDGSSKANPSPTKWRNPVSSSNNAGSSSNPAAVSPTPGPSTPQHSARSHSSPGHFLSSFAARPALNFKKLMNKAPFGKDDHSSSQPQPQHQQQQPQLQVVPMPQPQIVRKPSPELLVDIDHSPLAGAMIDPMLGNSMPLLQNGGHHHHHHQQLSQEGNSDNSTENYSDHESGSSFGGEAAGSGRNSNQSPTESCAAQVHISALPENVLENIFSFLELVDTRNASMVCQSWNRVVGDENSEVWRTQCFRRMSREVVYSELLTACPSFKAKLRAHIHSWNPLDCSRNIYVKPNGFTIHRNPVAQSTDGARGRIGFNRGRHAWEIVWEGPLGTVAVVGVATQQADVRAQGYIALLGKDDQSWGWNLVENLLLHNGDSQGNYPVINNAPRYQVGEKIRVILDCEDNTLSFEKNFEFLGVAFRGLPNREKLFPAVSAVYGNTEISMVYLGPPLDG